MSEKGPTAADALVEHLMGWGVEVIFGLPGDGINGIMEALRKRREKIRFVQVRHEESAALAAVGYAKFTGRLGVCLATTGPGAIHLLNGLYDAKFDQMPVLAITGLSYLPNPARVRGVQISGARISNIRTRTNRRLRPLASAALRAIGTARFRTSEATVSGCAVSRRAGCADTLCRRADARVDISPCFGAPRKAAFCNSGNCRALRLPRAPGGEFMAMVVPWLLLFFARRLRSNPNPMNALLQSLKVRFRPAMLVLAACAVTPVFATSFEKRVSASADDAEQKADGTVNLTGGDLGMMVDSPNNTQMGLRFTAITIPQGATITNAYIQFTADENDSATTSLTVITQSGRSGDNVNIAGTASHPMGIRYIRWERLNAAGTAVEAFGAFGHDFVPGANGNYQDADGYSDATYPFDGTVNLPIGRKMWIIAESIKGQRRTVVITGQ